MKLTAHQLTATISSRDGETQTTPERRLCAELSVDQRLTASKRELSIR